MLIYQSLNFISVIYSNYLLSSLSHTLTFHNQKNHQHNPEKLIIHSIHSKTFQDSLFLSLLIMISQSFIQQNSRINLSFSQYKSKDKQITFQNPVYGKLNIIFSTQNNTNSPKLNFHHQNHFKSEKVKNKITLETQPQSIIVAINDSIMCHNDEVPIRVNIACKQKQRTHKLHLQNHRIKQIKKPHISHIINQPQIVPNTQPVIEQNSSIQSPIYPIITLINTQPCKRSSNQQDKFKQLQQKIQYYQKMQQFYLQQISCYREDNKLLEWKLQVVVQELISLTTTQEVMRKSIKNLQAKGIDKNIIQSVNRNSFLKLSRQSYHLREGKQNQLLSAYSIDQCLPKSRQKAHSQMIDRPLRAFRQYNDRISPLILQNIALISPLVQQKLAPQLSIQQTYRQNKLSSQTMDYDSSLLPFYQ